MKRLLSLLLVTALFGAYAPPALARTAPVAASFSTAVPANRQSLIQLRGSDAEGTSLTYATVSTPTHGALSSLNASTGYVVYTPTTNYTGSDSFTYTVTSGGETSAAGTVTITVTNAKTTVSDTITDASGNPRSGKVTFILTQLVTTPAGITPVGSSVSAALNSSGQFTAQLYPSRSLSPAAYYQVWFADSSNLNRELLGVYDIPAATSAVTLTPYRVTDTNLAARYTFASEAAVSALSQAVSSATLATLTLQNITSALGYTPANQAALGTMAAQNASSVAITGGTLSGVTCVGCTNIGTGSSGGVANTGDTVVSSDSESDGVGKISLQTGGVERASVEADGTVKIGGQVVTLPFNVKSYGAKGDGTTDDTAAVANAVAALNSAGGGVLFFPPGRYKTSGGFTITVPATISGVGGSDTFQAVSYASRVDCTSPTAVLFTVTALSGKFENIALVNTSGTTPTAGAAIVATHATLSYQKIDYDHVDIYGFYDNIDTRSGSSWYLTKSTIRSPVRYGLRVRNLINPDAGDWAVSDTVFGQGVHLATAAIQIESAGGWKITNVKINGIDSGGVNPSFEYGIYAGPITPGATSVFLVNNTSIENVRFRGIHVGNWSLGRIEGIEYGIYAGSAVGLYLDGTSDTVVDNIVGASNGVGYPLVILNNTARIKLGKLNASGFNPWVSFTGTYTGTGHTHNDGWTAVTFQNGWANIGGTYPAAKYSFQNGMVHVRAGVTGGTAGSVIGTLPVGMRPAADIIRFAWENGAARWVSVNTAGQIIHSGGSTASVSFDFSFLPH